MPIDTQTVGPDWVDTLPCETTSFVGRDTELQAISDLLGTERLVTLVGPGGIGKTRLALRAAAQARGNFRDGVRLVKLADVLDPDLVPAAVSDALGLQGQSGAPLVDQLKEVLSHRDLLLVLDNCEHLLESAADLVNEVLPAAPHLHVLATSRQSLGTEAEHTWSVPPLSVPEEAARDLERADAPAESEAIALFVERTRAVVGDAQFSANDLRVTADICRRLDGMPLAIELAAVRTRSLSLQQIRDGLEDRFDLLTVQRRGGVPRHLSLRSLIDWSFELCTPAEQAFWSLASVFAGGFDLAAAQAVCLPNGDSPWAAVELIDALIDKSILRTERGGDTMRYRMLETIRSYGEERMVCQDGWEAACRRHRDYFHALAEGWQDRFLGPDQVTLCRAYRWESANLQRALEYSTSHPGEEQAAFEMAANLRYYFVKSALSQGRMWHERALRRAPEPTAARAMALWSSVSLAILAGEPEAGRAALDECRAIAVALDDEALAADERVVRGWLEAGCGNFSAARAALEPHGLTACRYNGLIALQVKGIVALVDGDLVDAQGTFERLGKTCEELGETLLRSRSLDELTYIAWLQGDLARARVLVSRALQLHLAVDDGLGIARSLEYAAWAAADDRVAAQLLGASGRALEAVGAKRHRFNGEEHPRCVERLTQSLGEVTYRSAFDTGRALSLDQAVELARAKAPDCAPALTPREIEVARLVAQGMSNRRIAESLFISPRTVETHVEHILTKLGLEGRGQVAPRLATESATRSTTARETPGGVLPDRQ